MLWCVEKFQKLDYKFIKNKFFNKKDSFYEKETLYVILKLSGYWQCDSVVLAQNMN